MKARKKNWSGVEMLDTARTLKDLRARIDEAISILGENATWYGFDDEGIYLEVDQEDKLVIYPIERNSSYE